MRYRAADLVWSHPRACPCRPASAGSLHDRSGGSLRQPEGRPCLLPPLREGREQGAAAGGGRRRLRASALCRRGRTARSGRRSPSSGRSGTQPLDLVRAPKRLRCRPRRPAQTVDVEQPAVPRGRPHAASSDAHRRTILPRRAGPRDGGAAGCPTRRPLPANEARSLPTSRDRGGRGAAAPFVHRARTGLPVRRRAVSPCNRMMRVSDETG